MKKYIGIDLGTSGVKLILVDEKGKILKEITNEYPLQNLNPNWSEQNPSDWWEQVKIGLKEITKFNGDSDIDGISFSGQMHGLVILDEFDNVIRPCILWNDGRSDNQTKYFNEVIGKEKLSEYTGNIAFPGFTAPKLLWMKDNELDNFNRISKIMLPKDYIVYKLTGNFVTDYSDASGTLLLNVKNKKWSKEMCDICNIKVNQLPELHESYDIVGTVLENVCDELGLSSTTKVIVGAADNAAAAIGTNTLGKGKCNISLGTSGTILISDNEFKVDKGNLLHSFAHADGYFYQMGCILSAASSNKWWLEKIIFDKDYDKIEHNITNVNTDNLIFLPYLNGERCPYNDVNIRGGIFGLSSTTTQDQISKCILEGVGFALKDCMNIALENNTIIEKVTICGGGSKNKLWCQIIADILNLPICTFSNDYGASYGACILAMKGCNPLKSFEELMLNKIHYSYVYLPNNIQNEKYEKKYKVYKQFYPLLKKIVND